MPTLVNNLRAIRGPVTAVPMVGASGVVVEPDTVNNQVVVRADETVLFDAGNTGGATSGTFSESLLNFEYVEIYYNRVSPISNNNNLAGSIKLAFTEGTVPPKIMISAGLNTISSTVPHQMYHCLEYFDLTNTTFSWSDGCNILIQETGTSGITVYEVNFANIGFTKVIGINRKA